MRVAACHAIEKTPQSLRLAAFFYGSCVGEKAQICQPMLR